MTVQQLEYVIAVDNYRHFAKAAEACYVTQPTLSMMIQKLEEELNVKIFDRAMHPVKPTVIGKTIIEQARVSLKYFNQIKETVEAEQDLTKGSFSLGIIPTIAPYLVPELLKKQRDDMNDIELRLKEATTAILINNILTGTLDGGLLAGPINHANLIEYPVYYEKFYAYVSKNDKLYNLNEIDLEKIDINSIWLLENVHCFRGQIERLCQMKKKSEEHFLSVKYEAGSIDTLMNIVDLNYGITIIPELFAMGLGEEKQENLRPFKDTIAVREVNLVVSKEYVRKTILNKVLEDIKSSIPKSMRDPKLREYVIDL